MSNVDIIRAWKDEEYRLSLTEAQLAALPPNPAGLIELQETDLANIAGGARPRTFNKYCQGTRVFGNCTRNYTKRSDGCRIA